MELFPLIKKEINANPNSLETILLKTIHLNALHYCEINEENSAIISELQNNLLEGDINSSKDELYILSKSKKSPPFWKKCFENKVNYYIFFVFYFLNKKK